MTTRQLPVEQIIQSVESKPNADNGYAASTIFMSELSRGPILSAWGSRARLREQREWLFSDYNTMFKSVAANLAKKIVSTPAEISGNIDPARWQKLVFEAPNYGAGWDPFISITVKNFLTYDTGAVWELTGAGPVDEKLMGPVTGIKTLDPLYCYYTGDPVYPVYYRDWKDGGWHKLHYTRTYQIVDMPQGENKYPGWGLSALSRAITLQQREALMAKYVDMDLDDKPKPGVAVFKNMTHGQYEMAVTRYLQQLQSDEQGVFGQTLLLFGIADDVAPDLQYTTFSQTPEKFDFVAYTELDAKLMALAIGVDPQDVLPLSSGNLGTGTQTEILAAQARGKTEGQLRSLITRGLNWAVLPDALEFAFAYRDGDEDLNRAQIAASRASTVQVAASALTIDEIRAYLVATDDVFAEVLRNDDGTLRTLTDADPTEDERVAGDETQIGDEAETQEEAPTILDAMAYTPRIKGLALKEWLSTRQQFINRMAQVLEGPYDDIRGARRLRSRITGLLRELGQQAYLDGMQEAGSPVKNFGDATLKQRERFMSWLADQSGRITDLHTNNASSQQVRRGLSQDEAQQRAVLWANKTLREIYNIGKAQVPGVREQWLLGIAEHCRTCMALHGQVHTGEEFDEREFWPGSDVLLCGGFECKCRRVKTELPVRGDLSTVPTAA
jgi:hypothetical protein